MTDIVEIIVKRRTVSVEVDSFVGVPAGGGTGQVLGKSSGENFDLEWITPPGGEDGGIPVGGTAGQVLAKASDSNYDTQWTDSGLDGKVDKVSGKGLSTEDYTTTEKQKLAGIAGGATANETDAHLKDRTNHTGTQPASTISDFEATASAAAPVQSVAGRTGQVVLAKADVSLGNVDNTADVDKPVSTAQQAALDNKVDKVAGRGLSEENYTSAEKSKLAALESSRFKGQYTNLSALNTAHPDASPGDYADVDSGVDSDVKRYVWDDTDSAWIEQLGESASLTDAQIKTQYENNPDTNAYTDAEKSKLGGVEPGAQANTVDSVNGQAGDVSLSAPNIPYSGTLDSTDTAAALDELDSEKESKSALGSAAYAGVMESLTDATADRLMPVGAFGLGGDGVVISALNDSVKSGIYRVSSSDPDIPTATTKGSVLVVQGSDNAYTVQIFMRGSGGGDVWVRYKDAGSWTPWGRVFDQRNILGTVSQSGGVPTGAIIERGSNANGEYVKFADGTLICTHALASSSSTSTQWTFPTAFSSTPSFSAATAQSGASRHGNTFDMSATSLSFNAWNESGARSTQSCRLIAIGRWF